MKTCYLINGKRACGVVEPGAYVTLDKELVDCPECLERLENRAAAGGKQMDFLGERA